MIFLAELVGQPAGGLPFDGFVIGLGGEGRCRRRPGRQYRHSGGDGGDAPCWRGRAAAKERRRTGSVSSFFGPQERAVDICRRTDNGRKHVGSGVGVPIRRYAKMDAVVVPYLRRCARRLLPVRATTRSMSASWAALIASLSYLPNCPEVQIRQPARPPVQAEAVRSPGGEKA